MSKFAKKKLAWKKTEVEGGYVEEQVLVAAEEPKKVWKKKEAFKKKREPFKREYTREVKFEGQRDPTIYVWVFEEYKVPDDNVPQFRLKESKFVMEDRYRQPLPSCPVVWMVDMKVRLEAYADFEAYIVTEV